MASALTLKSPLAANASVNEDDVIAAKTALMNFGLYEVPEWGITGVPDRALFDAIRTFQKGTRLKTDGVMKPGGETETTLKTAAELVRRHGRNGDTILAHISPAEAELLHRVTDGGSINPETGLPEFFLGSLLGGLASRFVGSDSRADIGGGLEQSFGNAGDGSATRKVSQKIGGPLGDDIANSLGNTVSGAVGGVASNGLTNTFGLEEKPALQPTAQPAPSPISDGVKDLLNPDYSSARTPGFSPIGSQPRAARPSAAAAPKLGSPTLGSPARTSPSKPQPKQQTPWLPPLMAAEPRVHTQEIKGNRPSLDLPAEILSSNARTAGALMKTTDFSAIKPHIQDAWTNGGEQGRAEVMNLAQQMKDRNPEHGTKFVEDMGLDALHRTGENTSQTVQEKYQDGLHTHTKDPRDKRTKEAINSIYDFAKTIVGVPDQETLNRLEDIRGEREELLKQGKIKEAINHRLKEEVEALGPYMIGAGPIKYRGRGPVGPKYTTDKWKETVSILKRKRTGEVTGDYTIPILVRLMFPGVNLVQGEVTVGDFPSC